MLRSWGLVVEVFGVVSGQGNNEENANVMNVIIWVEGAVLEYRLRMGTQGGRPDFGTKENPVMETV